MNEEKDQKPEGSEHDLSELAKHSRPQPNDMRPPHSGSFMSGCGIVLGVFLLMFFLVLGTCFLG